MSLDGLFVWQAESRLDVPYRMYADEASFRVDRIVCQQSHRTRDPNNFEFFSLGGVHETVTDGQHVGSRSHPQPMSGVIAVREGDRPAIDLGVSVDIEVEEDGRAGTKWPWGSLVIPPPPQYDSWGIEYSYVRVRARAALAPLTTLWPPLDRARMRARERV